MSRAALSTIAGLWVGLALSGTARAACEQPVSAGQVAQELSVADAAFADLDEQTFRQSVAHVRAMLPCLSEPLNSSQAGSYHKIEAFSAFLDRDHAAAVQSFRSMLAASPGFKLSDLIAPDGHPLRTDFEIAQGLPPVPGRPLPAPVEGRVQIDGRTTDEAPTTLPFVLQRVGDDGAVYSTDLVEVGASLPAWESVPERPGRSPDGSVRRKATGPLAATAVVAGVTSAALYGVSHAKSRAFWDPATADADLEGLRKQTNGAAYGAVGAGIVAVGAGAAALVTFTW
ncbi:MAG: hypothetical protein H6742_00835 [Alphaproteobacteria bacterium]|nr:hypothetical protein [Alphaproteobacteria bacterium]